MIAVIEKEEVVVGSESEEDDYDDEEEEEEVYSGKWREGWLTSVCVDSKMAYFNSKEQSEVSSDVHSEKHQGCFIEEV